MSEKHFFGSNGRFKGSMDDDGRIYDDRHRLMGYVKDGTVYDTCNIPHGHITDSGMVRDNSFQEVGQEYGTGFSSRGPRRELGRVRADILSEGRGRDYGAFQLLDRDQRHQYDSCPYDDDNDDDEADEEDGEDDWADDFTPEARPSYKRGRTRQRNSQSDMEKNIDGCVDGLGGCLGVIFVIVLLYQLVKHFGS